MKFDEILMLFSDNIEHAVTDDKQYLDEWIKKATSEQLGLILTFFLAMPIKMLCNKAENFGKNMDNADYIAMEIYKSLKLAAILGQAPVISDLFKGILPLGDNTRVFSEIVRKIYPDAYEVMTTQLTDDHFKYFMKHYIYDKYGEQINYTILCEQLKIYIDEMLMSEETRC